MRNVYVTDGSVCGFFTAVFDAYLDVNAYLSASDAFQTELGDRFVRVIADREKAARVVKKLRQIDGKSLYEIDYILRTSYENALQTAFSYIRLIVKHCAPARERLSEEAVQTAMLYVQRVSYEREHLSGFLRFHEAENGVFYAACSPDHDIVDLLMPHFCARLKGTPFIVHDIKRKTAGLSDGKDWTISPAGEAEIVFSESEDRFLALWKKYYRTVAIPARKNEKLMKRFMPVRYWAFMPEKTEEEEEKFFPSHSYSS